MVSPDGMETLHKMQLDFLRHQEYGIMPLDFAELLITSGLVLNDDIMWIGYSWYVKASLVRNWTLTTRLSLSQNDFGYLLKLLTQGPIPTVEDDFKYLLSIWFPRLFDLKVIMKAARPVKYGLQELADEFSVRDHIRCP